MKSPRLAVRAVIYRDDSLLLMQHKGNEDTWYVTPGGGVKHGEFLEVALRRKVFEETGAHVQIEGLLFIQETIASKQHVEHLDQDLHQVEFFMGATYLDCVEAPPRRDKDHVEVQWVALSKLGQLTFYPKAMTEAFQTRRFPLRR